jgi:ubiquinone/menaquinone biosynthesis C-methylase UbiE
MADIRTYRQRFQDAEKAQRYAARFEGGSRNRIDRRERRVVQKIFSDLPDCRSVLDVPSGAGRFATALMQSNRRLIEMDVAMEILRHGEQRALKNGVQAVFLQADASRLPLANDAVDCVFCNRLLHHILRTEERAVILREFHRVSRRYVVVSFFDYSAFGGVRRMLKRLKGRKPPYGGQPTPEQFAAETAQAGFDVREIIPTGPVWVAQKFVILEKV